jgi:ATP-dependent helicase HrpA
VSDERTATSSHPAAPSLAVAEVEALRPRLSALTLRDEERLRRRLERTRRAAARGGDDQAVRRLVDELEQAEERVARRGGAVPAVTYPPALPVSARRNDLLDAIRENQVVVVAGETGSGKTTQLPKLCLELGRGVLGTIAHTQPRRLAARTVAERIADELDVPVGGAVGYAVRFSDRSSDETLVRLMTDGLLLAEIQHDRLLRRYDTIIVDEAHERSLNIDFLLGYLRQILPRRPDLKLIITSATIDPQRFSRHFGDAPVVEVSGRTYPVEVRYRPLTGDDEEDVGVDRDEVDAIGDAVEELLPEGPGDVLVFLSGEREIRDTADALRARLRSDVEVLPLYARLSTSEQRRVFRPHDNRRVVLATNVAETSLTVPGIRYVVDPGNARISRYSARLKVQRLPIEPISQASADQRKGRCGRTSAGICIRLYDERDFDERPRYTDPEILRTSLAAVILQMAAVNLGDVETFGFLDPPDARQIRDGLALLHELGAFDAKAAAKGAPRQLTQLGRRLAQLPVDPRMARMVLEADRLACADEVIVIAAALSIQDPRERPAEHREAADQQHARFADEGSDFLVYLNLWRHLRQQQREHSSNQFRRRCRAEYLHYLRVREWQDLVAQLRQAAKGAGIRINREPADPREIHLALLSGLLSHLGMRDAARRDYVGARGARFAIFPGSVLARRSPPSWVMVAELVETSRLWGRTAARIEPAWVEPLAGHLVKRSYDAPHWERRRASVVATERVTLYGLPIVTGRKVAYGRIDPVLSRSEFIRHGLVEGDWETRHAFLRENQRLLEDAEELEHRVRRRGILVGDQALHDFYDARIPEEVVSGAHFDAWWKEAGRREPERLTFDPAMLVDAGAAAGLDPAAWPSSWRQGGSALALSYRFEPGSEDDGVTVEVPLARLGELREDGFDWLVPGLRLELVTTLMRRLPKDLRRRLVPVPDVAAAVLERLEPGRGALPDVLTREVERVRGVRVPREAWDVAGLPPHLRMGFRVCDEHGTVLGEGRDLAALRERLRPRLREELAAATRGLERRGLRQWTFGELPRTVGLPRAGQSVRGYPALVDEGDGVGIRVLDTPQAQAASMSRGTRRLLVLTIASPLRRLQDALPVRDQLTLSAAPHDGVRAVLEDVRDAAIDALVAAAGGPAWDEAGFADLRARVAGGLPAVIDEVLARVLRVLEAHADVHRALEKAAAAPLLAARHDVERQLRRLVYRGFAGDVGARRLPDIERYLKGAGRRLERLAAAPAPDADRMRIVNELEAAYRERLEAVAAGGPVPESLREVPWLLEELRVSQFAQGLGTRGPVSVKRIRRLLETAGPGG